MNPIGMRHLACVVALNHLLVALSEGRYFVSVQNPISAGVGDEPQPDLSLLKERPHPDAEAPPGPEDILLVVEVSDTTLAYDRNVKLPLYASAGIPEVWLANLRGEKVEVFTGMEGDRYAGIRAYVRGDEVRSATVPGLILPIAEILG